MSPQRELQSLRKAILELRGIPPPLRPLSRAFLLGYAFSVTPRLLTTLLQFVSRLRQRRAASNHKDEQNLSTSLKRILKTGFDWRRFPTFCAVLVGGSTLLEKPFRRLFRRIALGLSEVTQTRLSRWTSTLVAAWVSLQLLQSKPSEAYTEVRVVKSNVHPGVREEKVELAGRTLDLSLFAFCRAVDILVGELWSLRRARRKGEQKWTNLETIITQSTDSWIFVCSCALIMWAWFYHPSRLPQAYRRWIASAAAVDTRLIEALQRCRRGELRYGEDNGQAHLLQSMCKDYNWPLAWGDPSQTVPFPCEMVHMGCGPSCEVHAFSRLARSWRWSMAMYLPLNLALLARKPPTAQGLASAVASAARSSAFLGVFITLFYYGVCLGRTKIGPRLLGRDSAARTTIDGGVCVGCGCFLCGWSVLIETASRRKDMALFVAPRALATLFPRKYALDKQWRETLMFAASTAVVFTCASENKARVRGVLGKVLGFVLKP